MNINIVKNDKELYVSGDGHSKIIADKIISETFEALNRMYEHLKHENFSFIYSPSLGESNGIADIITGLELLRKYAHSKELDKLTEKISIILEKTDFEKYNLPDCLSGMAGLVSAMCRFDTYSGNKEIIRKAADSLMTMKKLEYNEGTLWQSFNDRKRAVSGAGHGSAGIAEAFIFRK